MVKSSKTAQEFIQGSFSPIIAILCSPKVENVVSKNNLSLAELFQPFGNMDWEGQFREPGGSVCTVKNWKLIIRDVNWKPLQPMEARKQLNNSVLYNFNDKTVSLELENHKFDVPQSTPWFDAWRETYLEVQFPSDHEFTKHFLSCLIVGTTNEDNILDCFNSLNQQYAQLQNVSPPKLPKWFNSGVLKTYLLLHDVSSVSKEKADSSFDTLKQTFGAANCFFLPINSKTNTDANLPTDLWAQFIKRPSEPNIEMSSSLTTLAGSPLEPPPVSPSATSNEDPGNHTASSNPEVMHPLTTSENDVYDNANSLQTHSFSGSSESVSVAGKNFDYSSEVYGAALNASDIDSIKKFLHEYASKALLPYLEKLISQLSEVVANRKGVSRSLLSATKRWFGTGKGVNTTVNNTVIYLNDCPELQLRRLGDLWFLCGQWHRAYDTYHTAKREFYADSAWLCYAGAVEMAAISAFMAGDANRKTHGYMEESITTYMNTCRMVQYAVRATLLSVLCLSSSGLHGEAAKQLIRMTSEDSDLRSAMLLEQASLCFLSGPGSKAMCRKYAFHMVLAGHRFSKAGQKKHAYRCYKQAYQVYAESGWRLSTDHVQFALGRLAGALKRTRDAVQWLAAPLAPAAHAALQPPHQQDAFLREYMMAHQQWLENSEEFKDRLPVLPLPLLERSATVVLSVGPAPLSSPGRVPATSLTLQRSGHDEKYWHKLEEMLLQVAQGSVPMIFKPTVDLYTEATDVNPIVPRGEPIQISITLRNPLKITLILKDVELLWEFEPSPQDPQKPEDVLKNEPAVAAGNAIESNVIFGPKLKSVILEGDCTKVLTFSVTPLKVGQICVHGLAYKLVNGGEGGTPNGNSVTISGKVNLVAGESSMDKLLFIKVMPEAPCLQMTFSDISTDVISGEMLTIDVEFRNVGPESMSNLHIAVSHPECIALLGDDTQSDDFDALYENKYKESPVFSDERSARTQLWRAACCRHVLAGPAGGTLSGGGGARARLLLRPRAHASALRLLAYYRTGVPYRPYRLLRHEFALNVTEFVELSITPRRSLITVNQETIENMNLAVEVKNISNEKDDNIVVKVMEASLLSRNWKLTDLTPTKDKDNPLNAHERLHLIFKARRILEDIADKKVEYSCIKISKGHPQSVPDVNQPPYSKFLLDTTSSITEPLVQDTGNKIGLIRSMFVLRWLIHDKTKNRKSVGQHCIWLECFTKALSHDKENIITPDLPSLHLDDTSDSKPESVEGKNKSKNDNVVLFRLEHSKQISHDFTQKKLCMIPITINIVNCYEVPVNVFIDMSKQQNRESCGELGWAGALSDGPESSSSSSQVGVSVELARLEARRVCVSALCSAPGCYLLGGDFTVTARRHGNNADTHVATDSSLLLVTNAD